MSQRVIVPWLMGKSSNGPVSRSDTPTDSSDVVLKDYDDGYNNAGLEVTSEFVGVANRELINRELVNLENAAVNIDNSSDVIIGPVTQFNVNGNVTIYQNKDEQPIGIENKSDTDNGALNDQLARQQKEDQDVTFSTKKKFTLKLYLGIIFLLLILSGITVILVFVLRKNTQPPFEASQGSTTINSSTIENHRLISKAEWNGRPPVKTLPLKLPVGFVIIKHLGSGNVCGSFESCAHKMQTLQVTDISINELDDIYFNFAVGGDGNVYEGRGWDVQPAYTSNNIDIVMLGNFALDEFTPKMINGTKALLEYGLQIGKLASDYKLINHNQTYATLSPGINVIREVKTWPHYDGGLYMGNPLLAGRRGRSKPAF